MPTHEARYHWGRRAIGSGAPGGPSLTVPAGVCSRLWIAPFDLCDPGKRPILRQGRTPGAPGTGLRIRQSGPSSKLEPGSRKGHLVHWGFSGAPGWTAGGQPPQEWDRTPCWAFRQHPTRFPEAWPAGRAREGPGAVPGALPRREPNRQSHWQARPESEYIYPGLFGQGFEGRSGRTS